MNEKSIAGSVVCSYLTYFILVFVEIENTFRFKNISENQNHIFHEKYLTRYFVVKCIYRSISETRITEIKFRYYICSQKFVLYLTNNVRPPVPSSHSPWFFFFCF